MSLLKTTALLAAIALATPALAAEPAAQVSAQEFVKAIQDAPAAPAVQAPGPAATPASPDAAPAACAAGQGEDEDGLCAPMVKTRGFSLATVGSAPASPAAPRVRPPVQHVATLAPRHVAVAPPRTSRLSDLLITFKLGSSELTDQGRANAKSFAAALRDPSVASSRFEIAGHTDASGTADRNGPLSQARADAVKNFLVSQGVDASRLEAKGYGSSELAEPAHPDAGANRRVEARRLD